MSASTMGIILVALAYIGIPAMTANGTEKRLSFERESSKNHVGTNQCIRPHTVTQSNIYGTIFLVIPHHSFDDVCHFSFQVLLLSIVLFLLQAVSLILSTKSAMYFSNHSFPSVNPQTTHKSIPETT